MQGPLLDSTLQLSSLNNNRYIVNNTKVQRSKTDYMFIDKATTNMASFSGTFFAMIAMLIVGGSAIGGQLQFANAIDINTSIANKYHIIATTTCIDQSVTLGIHDNDIDNFDAQDVSSHISPMMVKDMVLSKVILNADNGNCDIEMDIDGEATVMMYRPSSGHEGVDKCVYEMCVEESGEMDTEECHEMTMDIQTVDCSLPSLLAAAEETVVGVDEEWNASEESQEVRYDS